jgi:anti-sigma B factor antagonist
MFEITINTDNEVRIKGRFDATQTDAAKHVFNTIQKTITVDFKELDYISSAGLGVLLMTQKRLKDSDDELILKNLNSHIREVFKYAGFDMIFKID